MDDWVSKGSLAHILLVGGFFCLGCGGGASSGEGLADVPVDEFRSEGTLLSGEASGLVLEYKIRAKKQGETLEVRARFPRNTPTRLEVDSPGRQYLGDVRVFDCDSSRSEGISLDECTSSGCCVSYEFRLGEAADEIAQRGVAVRWGDAIVSPPSTWLLRPVGAPPGCRYRYEVETDEGYGFATGSTRSEEHPGVYEAALPRRFYAPYAVFGRLRSEKYEIGGAEFEFAFWGEQKPQVEKEFLDWARTAGETVSQYFGGFPTERLLVLVKPDNHFGSAMGIGGASVILGANNGASRRRSSRRWVATHEMVHVGFPSVARRHRWASEGVATYVESVARVQSGDRTKEAMWKEFRARLPLGQPTGGDRGLDRTPSWGRTYWGGALFWFIADVQIQKSTAGRSSLRDALRGIVRSGGDATVHWPLKKILSAGDRAVQAHVLVPLYLKHRHDAVSFELEKVFSDLGVTKDGRLDDSAEFASIRRAIERPAMPR